MNVALDLASHACRDDGLDAQDDPQTADVLFGMSYPQLRRLAHRIRTGWSGDATLGTTVLIHEAYLKLARHRDRPWHRGHFLAVAAHAMRQALLNHAERRRAGKRGGALHRTTLDGLSGSTDAGDELVALQRALCALEHNNPRLGKVVECRFFGGFSIEETAEATGTSPATVKRDWCIAQAFLRRELAGASEDGRA